VTAAQTAVCSPLDAAIEQAEIFANLMRWNSPTPT
jgi:hypothetical protein